MTSEFSGDGREGSWFHDHDSEGIVVAWNEHGTVVLGLDLGTYNFNEELSLDDLLRGLPDSLAAPAAAARAWVVRSCRDGATSAHWYPGWLDEREIVRGRNHSLVFEDVLNAAFEGDRSLRERFALAAEDDAIALAITDRSAKGATTILPDEEALMFTATAEDDPVPRAENVEQAIELFRQVGVAWPGAMEAARHAGEEAARRRLEGDTDRGLALLAAVDEGDAQRVRELLAAGANVEKRMPPGWLEGVYGDDTPLLIAVRRGHHQIVEMLLDRGADPNSQVGGSTPLTRAATSGQLDLCKLLLQRGASLTYEWMGRQSALDALRHYAHVDVDVIRLLLDAGAPLPDARACDDLARIARDAGAEDLGRRLLLKS